MTPDRPPVVTHPAVPHPAGADGPGEERESLWWLTAAPLVWIAHFLACYLTAAVTCAKAESRAVSLDEVRLAMAVYTALALLAIAVVGWHGLRRHRRGVASLPHDHDTRGDRHRFLGFATLLLAGMSAVATIYGGLVAVFVETCY